MGETKHTPGPWRAGRYDMATIVDGYDSKWIYSDAPAAAVTDDRREPRPRYVAVASGSEVEDWDEVMANAYLIAAAPDLLAACIEAARYHRGGKSIIGRMLRAAISKATGTEAGGEG